MANPTPQYFYQFLGAHSLLIGLLPFFLPVYLWTHGLGLAGLSLLIGVSGMSFALSLCLWQRWSYRWPLRRLVALSFILEIALVFVVGLFTAVPGMPLFDFPANPAPSSNTNLALAAIGIGFFNGLYNGFFWTTQRTLFLSQLGLNDTGKQYGNFQIFVTLFLKAGILLGGFLLELGGFIWLLALSAGISAVSNLWLADSDNGNKPLQLSNRDSVGNRQSLTYTDQRGSRQTFAIDGIFLYLESHFWTLSLFLLVKQDFTRLGFAVVALALGFAVLFFLIKNRIDKVAVEHVYRAAVLLYAVSWLLRFTLTEDSPVSEQPGAEDTALLLTLLVITFFSTFFRLVFNKRFFDVARNEGAVRYLLLKSYSSQWLLGIFFASSGALLFIIDTQTHHVLQVLYLLAAVLSLVYLGYRDKPQTPG